MKIRWLILAICMALFSRPARAQQQGTPQRPGEGPGASSSSNSSSRPPEGSGDSSNGAAHSKSSSAKTPAPSEKPVNPKDPSTWNSQGAYHDVNVGNFYKAKGDPDAAIARYQDAIRLKPDFAKPRLLLAEIYEKRGDGPTALKYYKEYLQVFPDAPEAKKVQKKIEKLSAR